MKMKALSFIVILSALSLTACSEYWWTRGQPPRPGKLYTRAQATLNEAKHANSYQREEVIELSGKIEKSLNSMIKSSSEGQSTREAISNLKSSFVLLESKLSKGSLPAYAELSGQLRNLSLSEEVATPSIELFAA